MSWRPCSPGRIPDGDRHRRRHAAPPLWDRPLALAGAPGLALHRMDPPPSQGAGVTQGIRGENATGDGSIRASFALDAAGREGIRPMRVCAAAVLGLSTVLVACRPIPAQEASPAEVVQGGGSEIKVNGTERTRSAQGGQQPRQSSSGGILRSPRRRPTGSRGSTRSMATLARSRSSRIRRTRVSLTVVRLRGRRTASGSFSTRCEASRCNGRI